MSSIWVPVVVTCTVPLIFLVVGMIVPCRYEEPAVEVPFDELKQRYAKWEKLSVLLIVPIAALFTWVIGQCLIQWQASVLPPVGSDEFRQAVPMECWYGFGFCLALVCTALPLHLLYGVLLGDRYPEYVHYGNRKVGYNAVRGFCWLSAVIVVGCAGLIGLGMDTYSMLDAHKLTTNGFLSFEEQEHPLTELHELRRIDKRHGSKGGIIERPYVELVFNDGYTWSSCVLESRTDGPDWVPRLLSFPPAHSGLPVVEYEFKPR